MHIFVKLELNFARVLSLMEIEARRRRCWIL